ncbi:putative cysteine proteinase [Platanthera guangdongensis]|uniref:Cysteine proteinase n=1 Tax=Platanthera guangdongensis TaxID=2320717 RepID=A0ABR2M9Q4_9ASPA
MHLMIYTILFFLLFFPPSSSSSSPNSGLFESWCLRHGRLYASESEKLARLRVFEENLAFVKTHNSAANSTYSLALNAFADLTPHEFRAARLGLTRGLNCQLLNSSAARAVAAWRFSGELLPPSPTLLIGGRRGPSPKSRIREAVGMQFPMCSIEGAFKVLVGLLLPLAQLRE